MQIADRVGCYGVAALNFVGEYPSRVGEYGTEWLSWDYWWRMGVVSIAETEFSASTPFRDPDNTTSGASRAYISPWTNPGGDNAKRGRDIEECHQQDGILNRFQTLELSTPEYCESHPRGFQHQYWRAGKPMEYPPCIVCSLHIWSEPSSNSQLSYCAWSFAIFLESHPYKTKNSVGSQIVIWPKIGFTLHVLATLGFHSVYGWCYQTLWLFLGAPEDPEDDTVMEKHG